MRKVEPWRATHDDQSIPLSVKRRIVERQGSACAISGMAFDAKNRPEFDHIKPLWLGGEHRETNLHAILGAPHKEKTKREAALRKKVYAQRDKHLGLKEKKPWNAKFKKKMSGEVIERE